MPDVLNLAPTYPAGVALEGEGAQLTLKAPTGAIAVELEPILRGEPGPSGTAASRYAHTQSIAAAVWTVPHNLGIYPSVMVADHLGAQIFADVAWVDANIVQVTHGAPITGFVYCG